jgi:hypothetical protein
MAFGPVQILLIDLIVVRKDDDGNIEKLQQSDLSQEELEDFGAIVGALIGIGADGDEGATVGAVLGAAAMEDGHVFDAENTWYVDDAIPPGTAAAVALLEHRWAIGLRDAIQNAGGFHLADAWIHPADLVAIGATA